MKSFPAVIVDDFFEDPDAIVEIASSLTYKPQEGGAWPGVRSNLLSNIDDLKILRLFNYMGNKILSIFQQNPNKWRIILQFQKIQPFSQNKWDRVNRGWVHSDGDECSGVKFGGIIYLNKNADRDTGTSLYKSKNGIYTSETPEIEQKLKLYSGKGVDIDEYEQIFDEYHNQFIETIRVDNIYNRLLLFGADTLHGVRTFGTEERLTLPFFCHNIGEMTPPLQRFI